MKLPTSIAIEHDLRDALDRMAAAELRSRSWLAEKLLREALAARKRPGRDEEVAQ
jgi:predicted transcriptional regulator